MKILFIHCNINTGNGPHFAPGVGSISSVLKEAGHETALIFLQEAIDRDLLLEKVKQENPDLVGFTTLTNQLPYIRQYTRWIREAFSIPVIHGGSHVTVAPEEALSLDEVDLICIGEGEFPVLELVERLENGKTYEDIANLWIKKPDGQIVKNPLRPLIQDLDALPLPDRELFNYRQLLLVNPMEATLLMAGRGCPFNCKYCLNNALQKLYRDLGKFCRLRSQERVLEEVRDLKKEYGIDRLVILDDTFTYNHKWLKRFCELYGDEFHLPFSIHVRVDTVDENILTMLKQAGCERIIAGIESGSERIRRDIMGRKMTNEQVINVFRTADRLGMKTWANYIIGVPTETPEEVEETIELNNLIRPNSVQVSVFFPFPGTELYDRCKEERLISDREGTSLFDGHSVLNLPTLTRRQIFDYVDKLNTSAARIKLEKEQKGDFDFLVKFPEAMVTAEEDTYVRTTSEIINGEERQVIFAHPESRISYTLELPEKARLFFGIGLSPNAWSEEKGSGVDFEITLGENGAERVVFSRYIDPKNNSEDQKWHDVEIELAHGKPESKQLHFVTTTKGRDKQYCWAVWSHPYLVGAKKTLSSLPVDRNEGGSETKTDADQGLREISDEELTETWAGKDRRLPQKYEPAYLTLKKVSDFFRRAADTLSLTPESQILDVGCAEKPYFPFFARKTRNYFGVDIAPGPQVDAQFDGTGLPFPDEVFAVVLSTQVLEHVRDPQALTNEMYRVLKKGGSAIISAPFVWEIHNYPTDYWRFSDQGIRELMQQFTEVTVENCGNSAQCLLQTFNLFIDRSVSSPWFKRGFFRMTNTIIESWARKSSDQLLPANYIVTGRK